MRIIVCGGRDWLDAVRVRVELDLVARSAPRVTDDSPRRGYPDLVIVHGGCRGVDAIAGAWAADWGYPVEVFPADWATFGKRAGPMRNEQMAAAGAGLCVAFWDGVSPGTQNMIAMATRYGIPVRVVPKK